MLLEAGADVMLLNHENKTAIDLADEYARPELAQMMRASLSEQHDVNADSRWKSDDETAKRHFVEAELQEVEDKAARLEDMFHDGSFFFLGNLAIGLDSGLVSKDAKVVQSSKV